MSSLSQLGAMLISPNKLIFKIAIGIFLGIVVGSLVPSIGSSVSLLGALFVKALKAIAPILVFTLVASAVANHQRGNKTAIKPIITLYCVGTLSAALVAVLMSFLFPVELILTGEAATGKAPESLKNVLQGPIFQLFDNPVNALLGGNYIALILWAVALGIGMQSAADSSKRLLKDMADAITSIVRFIITLAPFGIFGLVAGTVAATGLSALSSYIQLIAVLLSSMLIVALLVNPLIVFYKLRVNPYPLVLQCLRDSGMTAFFTRSSAANIPVNMALCKRLDVNPETYAVSIPLGASVNMGGAAITISVLTLATAYTLGIDVGFLQAFTLCVVASVSACGASGVAGGSLLLIPLACSLFSIPNDIAMQVVALGFIIGVVQDSAETALNSSTDVIFTVACDRSET